MTLKSEYEITEQAKEAAYVKRQADKPTGTTTQIKDIFDTYPELIRGKYNSLLDGLDTKFGSYRTSSAQDTIDNGKVDKVQGKGLSEADFTNEEKSKLAEFQWGSVASGSTGLVSGGDVYDAVSPKYQKPSGGIPKTDLSSDVQTTLGKADTALQTHQDITGKVDKVEGKGLSTNDYTNAEKSAVAGISGKADNNAVVHLANAETVTGKKTFSDDININGSKDVVLGSNKTNPQKIHYGESDRPVLHVGNSYAGCLVTDSDIETELAGKVDKVSGKGLSTEDYTSAEKTKLSGIEAGAQVNVITSDAASDNKTYGRKNGAWTEITGGGGGSSSWGQITGTLSDQTDLQTALDGKQATLTSGTNIRTVNSTSLLGSGNIFIPALEIISDDATFSEVYAIQQAGKTPVLDSGGEMYFMTGYSPTDYSFTNASFDTATGEYSINLYHLDNDDVWTLTNHTTFPPCTEMPSPAPALWGKTVQYIGSTDANYTHGYFYECVRSGMSSVWQQIDVQPHQSLSSYRTSAEQDVIDATKIAGVKVAGTELTKDADGKVNVPKASYNGCGVVKLSYTYWTAISSDGEIAAIPITLPNYSDADGYAFISKGTIENLLNGGYIQRGNIQRTVTIAVSDWTGTTATKTVAGVTATNTVIVDPSDATVSATAQGTDSLTFTASSTPSSDVTVKVVIL